MGMPLQQPIYYTAEMVRALNREERGTLRYETVHGELLVRNAPSVVHQRVVLELAHRLKLYLARERVGEVFISPADISWQLVDVSVQPDVFVIPPDASSAATRAGWDGVMHLPLAAEVLSPSTARHDRFTKRLLYQERRVPLYWIVDPQERVAEIWTPADTFPRVERERLVWHADGAAQPFVATLDELLGDAGSA